jgi:putative transposase
MCSIAWRICSSDAAYRIISARVVGAFPDGQSALMQCAARLRQIASSKWGQKRYLNMDLLKDQELEQQVASA